MVGGSLNPAGSQAVTVNAASGSRARITAALISVTALLVSVSVLFVGNGLQNTLVPIRANGEGFSAIALGLLGASYFLGFTLGCVFGPALIGRSGHIRAYLAMVSLSSVIALCHPMLAEPVFWCLLRVVTGFCFAVLYIVIESWLNEQSTNDMRGTVFSIYTAINLSMISAGQLLISVADPKSYVLFSLCSILVSLAALPLAFTRAVTPQPVPSIRPNLAKIYLTSPVGFGGCIAAGLATGAFWSLGPVVAQDMGYSTFGIGLFMSATVLGGAVAQWPLGAMSDRMDRRFVILIASLIAMTASLALVTVSAQSFNIAIAIAIAFGAGAFPVYSLSVAHSNDHAQPDEFVELSSGLLLVFGASAAVGPVMAGVLRGRSDEPTLFLFHAIVFAFAAAFVVYRMSQRAAPDAEQRGDFKDSLIASETIVPLDTDQAIIDYVPGEETDAGLQSDPQPEPATDENR
jgi:MFS family permease